MKKLMAILWIVSMLGLTACSTSSTGSSSSEIEETETEVVTETEAALETEAQTEPETETESEEEAVYDREAAIAAYQAALMEIYENQILPDGTEVGLQVGDITENVFSVCDIDFDGRDELLIEYTTCNMSSMALMVCDYDEESGSLYVELSEFPNAVFYDNGAVMAGLSHNQGFSGDFWPYVLYVYDAEQDQYVMEAYVEAWDKSLSEVNYDGSSFPDDADTDGDGIVYYVMAAYGESYDNPIDLEDYTAWSESVMGGESVICHMALTEENISSIE